MKTVLILSAIVAVALAGYQPPSADGSVTPEFVTRQKQIFELVKHITQDEYDAEYYKVGKEYDIESHIDNFTNKKAVEEFLFFYHHKFAPKGIIFSVFNEKMRDEAIALYHLFYYAKDFETFYKTAAWARVYLNEGLFVYSYTIAVLHREDTKGIVLPSPYEIYPYYFVNSDVVAKLFRTQMQKGLIEPKTAEKYGIVVEDNAYVFYANYSGWYSYDNEEQKLSYFTEDIGLNTYYYYFHAMFPFWMNGQEFGGFKERRGELFYYIHQQILARYYMERLTNGLGEIPEFSWRMPFKTGYKPEMVSHYLFPFVTRNDNYDLQAADNYKYLEYLENYEKEFLSYLEQGYFKSYGQEVDLRNTNSINFVGNYWQSNADLYQKFEYRNYEQYYSIIAHILLGAGPELVSENEYLASVVAMEQFQTALRDPAFYQLYKRILYYFIQYKQYLEPYTTKELKYDGVKITNVEVGHLVTYYDFFDFIGGNAVFYPKDGHHHNKHFKIRQPRLDSKPFDVKIDYESAVAGEAIVKIFLAPKYDSTGFPISLEDNWMNFFALDYYKFKVNPGKNTIVRNSDDFSLFKDDALNIADFYKHLDAGKIPVDMYEKFFLLPERLMLPKGTKGGFPFQLFVMIYPYVSDVQSSEYCFDFTIESKQFGYPFDRPLNEYYFYQPNMYFKDVSIYHEGAEYYYYYNVPGYKVEHNFVPKH